MTALPSDADLLALCVSTEASNQPPDGMAAVYDTIRNRMRMRYQSDGTLAGTVLHHNAYSAFGFNFPHGGYEPAPDAYTPERVAKMLAAAKASRVWSKICSVIVSVDAGHYVGGEGYDRLTPDTVLYVNPTISHPDWATPAAFVTVIGQHSFYRDLTWRPHAPAAAQPPSQAPSGHDVLQAALSLPEKTS